MTSLFCCFVKEDESDDEDEQDLDDQELEEDVEGEQLEEDILPVADIYIDTTWVRFNLFYFMCESLVTSCCKSFFTG